MRWCVHIGRVELQDQHRINTRMHSSRMRTFSCSGRLLGGVGYLHTGECLPGGVHPPGHIDTCENITFPQLLLRTVTRRLQWISMVTVSMMNGYITHSIHCNLLGIGVGLGFASVNTPSQSVKNTQK